MKHSSNVLALLFIGMILSVTSRSISQDPGVDRALAFQKCVKEFLAGNGCDEILAYTSGAIVEESPPKALKIKDTYKNSEILFVKSIELKNGVAVVLAQTKPAKGPMQVHTFVLQEVQANHWKVKVWHTGHA